MTPSTASSLYTSGGDASLSLSWHDSAWIPILNSGNVLDYFCQRSNPFYDRTCNNEVIRMQRLDPHHITHMAGVEYILIHAQEPILYVIRKQRRHHTSAPPPAALSASRDRVSGGVAMVTTPLADYYIVAGVVYKSPDLGSVLNSRCFAALHACQTAFATAITSRDQASADAESTEEGSSDELGFDGRWHGVDRAELEIRAAHLRRVDSIIDQLTRKSQAETGDNYPSGVAIKSEPTNVINVAAETKNSLVGDKSQKVAINNPSTLKIKDGGSPPPPPINQNTLPTKSQITAPASNTISNKKNKPN